MVSTESEQRRFRAGLRSTALRLGSLILVWSLGLVWAFPQSLPPTAARHFQRAVEHLRSQQYAQAEEILEQLARDFPNHADIQEALAVILDLQGKPEAATPHFQAAVKLNPHSHQARLNLGANYFRRGLVAEAEKEFQAALKLRPSDPTIHFNLGTLYLNQRRFQDALPHLERAHHHQSEIFENGYQLALCYFFLQKHHEADQLLQSLAPRAGQRGEFFLLLGLNHKALGQDAIAQEAFRQASAYMPSSPEVYATLGQTLFELGLFAEASAVFEQIRERNPQSYEAAHHLVLAYQGAGQWEKARAVAQKALEKWPTADLYHVLGEVNERLENYLEAVQHFQRAAELEPSERNLYSLGYEFLVHWSWDAAAAVFQRGVELFPNSERLWLGLATAQFALGEFDQTIQALLKATAVAPASANAYQLMVAAFPVSRGHTEAVQQRLREFQQRHPHDPWANYYYAFSLLRTPDRVASEEERAEALGLLRRAVTLKLDLGEAHFELGRLFAERQQWPEAVSALEAAVKAGPDSVEAHYQLALAYQRAGRSAQAQALLARYRELKKEQDGALDQRAAQTTKFIYSLKR